MKRAGSGGSGCLIGCGLGAAMMLLIPLALFGSSRQGGLDKGGASPMALGTGGCESPLLPTISDQAKFAEAIDTYIKELQPRSPMVGTGQNFVSAGIQYGINPAWVIAIAQKESQFGTNGWAAEHANNAFGRTATDSQPHLVSPTGRKWYKYDSFAASAAVQTEYLKRRYIDEGLKTIEEITYKYAPPSENATETYITNIKQWMSKIITLAGGAVSCGTTTATASSSTPSVPGTNIGQCLNARELSRNIPAKNNRLAHTTLISKLEALWEKNKTWRLTEGCPPSSRHADRNHYNGRAVDIAINPPGSATPQQIDQLLKDVREIGFDDVLDEYRTNTQFKTGGHIHLEWHGN